MDLEGLREAINRVPFERFTIKLADGSSVSVNHPEYVAVGKRRAVVIQEDDSVCWLEPLLVVSLEWPSPKSKRGGNGSSKPRRDKS
ncbi:MAG: hypothetical protein KY475_04680 [Planctomycetes bacterium]|nr:hypothetical protein [Planctomycetota bacterium]